MAKINVTNVVVLDNPTVFTNPFQFEISFECTEPEGLPEDLEWKIVYIGSAEDDSRDLQLDCIDVGPIPPGLNRFVFQADPPDVSLIPAADLLGVTAVMLTCSFRGQQFVRIGYYVNNEYDSEELRQSPPTPHQPQRIVRNILADKPRVTRWQINWN